jgi:hypothetical protein
VSRSDPRRSTIIGVVGLLFGAGLIILGLFALSGRSSDRKKTEQLSPAKEFAVDNATQKAASVARDGPLLFQDPADFQRPIFLQHQGDDPATGWIAFDAVAAGCRQSLSWQPSRKVFVDPCSQREVDATGGDQTHYPTRVQKNVILVNLNPEAPAATPAS